MVAYSFQKRFVDHVQAGLEPGPWCPGMKRHTLRQPRDGRSRHARPEQELQLYTAMRTRHCRLIGRAVARVQIPVKIVTDGGGFFQLRRGDGAAPRSYVAHLAPVVQLLLERGPDSWLTADEMETFARTDGFASVAEMRTFFNAPAEPMEYGHFAHLDMVLIGWAPIPMGA